MQWIQKKTKRGLTLTNADLIISKTHYKKGDVSECQISLTFKNCSFKKITKTGNLVLGIEGHRIYFKEAGRLEGFKLTNFNLDGTTCRIKFLENNLPVCDYNIKLGDYNLEWDSNLGLFYIDGDNKLGE